MSVDDTSSQDSALIDDDLVEALGFEPVTTLVSDDDEAGSNHAAADEDPSDEYSPAEETNGHVVDELTFGDADVSANGDAEIIDGIEEVDVPGDVAAAAGAMVAAVTQTSTETDQNVAADDDLVGLIDSELTVPDVESDADDLARKADELLDSHRDDISVLDDDIELFDADDLGADDLGADDLGADDLDAGDSDELLDPTAAEPVVDAAGIETGVWADEEESIVLLNDGGPTEAREPIIDLSDEEPVARTEAVAEAEVRDPYADYELATPESVFAESPTSPPTAAQPAVASVLRGARDSSNQRRTKRLRARKSRRVIRHIDPWSVLTFSVLFHMFVFAALLLGSVLVWNAAIASGMVENVESFIQELGDYETFEINADVMFKAAVVVAGMLTLASSVLVVLLTVVFNLISDLVGGIRVTVIEEETVRVPVKKKSPKSE